MSDNSRLNEILEQAENNDVDAMLRVINIYFSHAYRTDPKIVSQYLSELMERNNASAFLHAGSAYASGDPYEKNIEKAIECYEKAGELGETVGYENIGLLYFDGIEVEQNYAKAYAYFQNTLPKIYCPDTYIAMGYMYENGFVVDKDIEKARSYYRKGSQLWEEAMQYIPDIEKADRTKYEKAKSLLNEIGE